MSQDDLIIANQAFPATRSDMNSNFQALGSLMSGASAPGTTYAYMWWADTTNGVWKQRDSSNSSWIIRGTLATTLVITKTATYSIALGDVGKTILCDATGGAITINLLAVATVGNPFPLKVVKIDSSANTVTLDGNASEVVNDATTLVLSNQFDGVQINCNATKWYVEANAGTITDAKVSFSDITTGDASITKHGYMKKLPNDATKYYDGTGAFTKPPGGLVYLGTFTASAVATLDLTSMLSSTYDDYEIWISNLLPAAGGGVSLMMRASTDNSTFDAGSNYSNNNLSSHTTTVGATGGSPGTSVLIGNGGIGGTSTGGVSGKMHLHNVNNTAVYRFITGMLAFMALSDSRVEQAIVSDMWQNSTDVLEAVRFLFSSGNITSGKVKIYGIAKS